MTRSSSRRRGGAWVAVLLTAALGLFAGLSWVLGWWSSGRAAYADGQGLLVPAVESTVRSVLWSPPVPLRLPGLSDGDVYEPRLSWDEQTLYFVRGRAGGSADLYSAQRTPSGWGDAVRLDALCSDADELGPEPTRDGRALYFYSDRAGGAGGYDVWVATLADGVWQPPTNLGPAVNSGYHEYGPAITPDDRLLFASNRPRATEDAPPPGDAWPATLREDLRKRTYDLYESRRSSAGFAPAAPIDVLNTLANEGAVAIAPQGDFAYFASDRPGGVGGFDLYRVRITTDGWGTIEPLGAAVNSASNELDPGLFALGYGLLFATDRGGTLEGTPTSRPAAPTYRLFTTVSRDVYADRISGPPFDWAGLWARVGTSLLWLLLALLAVLLLLALLRDAARRKLSLLARCLLFSLLAHSLLMLLLSFWQVTTSAMAFAREGRELRVSIASPFADELAAQVRGAFADAPLPNVLETTSTHDVAPPPIAAHVPALTPLAVEASLSAPAREMPKLDPELPRSSELAALATAEPRLPRAEPPPSPVAEPPLEAPIIESKAQPLRTASVHQPPEIAGALPQPSGVEVAREFVATRLPDPALAARRELSPSPPLIEARLPSAPMPSAAPEPTAAPVVATREVAPRPFPASAPAVLAMDASVAPPSDLARHEPFRALSDHSMAAVPAASRLPAPESALSARMPLESRSATAAPDASVNGPKPLRVTAAVPPAIAHADRRVPATPEAAPVTPTVVMQQPVARDARAPADPVRAAATPELAPAPILTSLRLPTDTEPPQSPTVGRDVAIERALAWLAAHQEADGRWDGATFDAECGECSGQAAAELDAALTALATLAFLSAGQDHVRQGPHRDVVRKAIEWLAAQQRDGDFGAVESAYSHAVATAAIAEAAQAGPDDALRELAARAIEVLSGAPNLQPSADRADAQGDTALLGWQVLALHSARLARVPTPPEALAVAARWMARVASPRQPGGYALAPGGEPIPAITAEALFVQLALGVPRGDPRVSGALEYLESHPPSWTPEPDAYDWFFRALALAHVGGEPRARWNAQIAPILLAHQESAGRAAGSWPPVGRAAAVGGRVYQTALCALILSAERELLPMLAQIEADESGGVLTGRVTSARTGRPMPGALVRADVPGDVAVAAYTDEDGAYELRFPRMPPHFALSAAHPSAIPQSVNVAAAQLLEGDARRDFVLEPRQAERIALETEPLVHHLGNDRFEGRINSQFQRASEGETFRTEFVVPADVSFSRVRLTMLTRGVQCPHRVFVNGAAVAELDGSPANGSFGPYAARIPARALRPGANELVFEAISCSGDLDDFEFVNVQIELRP